MVYIQLSECLLSHCLPNQRTIHDLIAFSDLLERQNPISIGVQHVKHMVQSLLLLLCRQIVCDEVYCSCCHIISDVYLTEVCQCVS